MKSPPAILPIILLSVFYGCNKSDRKFPEVKKLFEYHKTEFLPTLENRISRDKNAVYCVTLLYAWDQIRDLIKTPLQIDSKLYDLTLLNRSRSYLGVLDAGEYTASGEVEGDTIRATAEFKRSLPFAIKLTSFDNKLIFDSIKVASFGNIGYTYDISSVIQILYYRNDDNFIIKLIPKDKEHEIILFKSEKKFETMAEILVEINSGIEKGLIESKNEKLSWKYYLEDEDEVIIPKFKFNIETNYSTLEGNRFSSETRRFRITKAWQRTAFVFDETGAEIESESDMSEVTEEAGDEIPRPKKMVFDKPFFLMLKKAGHKNPYFGLWITNAELMVPE